MKKKEQESRPLLRTSSTTATEEMPNEYTVVAATLVEEDIDVSEEENNDEEQQSLQSSNAKNQAAVPLLGTEKTPLGEPIHVILLLMDPKTRRFEILRLEFDAVAKVSDIYRHISASATEITLKSQKYNSLINLKSERLDDSELISTYIDSAGIVIAVPSSSGESPEAVLLYFSLFLTDPKVQNMVSRSRFSVPTLTS